MALRLPDRPEVLRVEAVSKTLDGHPVLDRVGLALGAGQTLTVLGSSGAGKSTLLRLVAALARPDAGRIVLFGRDTMRLGESELLPLRQRMGVVFQGGALFDSLTVLGNIALPLRLHTRVSDEEIRARVARLLERVGLPGIEGQRPATLSGGMQKRVAVARALVREPELLLFDEPTAGLDPPNARMICELIVTLGRDRGNASLVVTHDLACAFAVSDRVALLHEGRLVDVAPPDVFRRSPKAEVRAFLDGALDRAVA